MARKTADEIGLDAAAIQAQRDTEAAALAAQQHGSRIMAQQHGAQTTTLSNGPIPEVKLAPVVGGATVGGDDVDPRIADRFLLDPNAVAPIIGDATKRRPFRRVGAEVSAEDEDAEPARQERLFVVLEDRKVLDATNQHRTTLRQGKVISDKHYNIVQLLRQGAKLQRVHAAASAAGNIDESMIDALTKAPAAAG
jgi:hypothetical protein